MPNYYPLMLDIRNRPALVIGGNPVAAEKAAALSAEWRTGNRYESSILRGIAGHGAKLYGWVAL